MKLLPPKSALRENSDLGFHPGDLIAYEQDGHSLLGAVLAYKKQKYQILNQRGRELELQAVRLHKLPGKLPSDSSTLESKTAFLTSLAENAQNLSNSVSLEELWTAVESTPRAFSMKELCDLQFSTASHVEYYALRLALLSDKIYFRRDKENFYPRQASTVEELRRQQHVLEEKRKVKEQFFSWIAQRIKSGSSEEIPAHLMQPISLLELIAAGADNIDNSKHKEAKELIEGVESILKIEFHGNREGKAYDLLQRAMVFGPRTNLSVIRYGIRSSFSNDSMRQAEQIKLKTRLEEYESPERGLRKDLTSLRSFTIDDVTTEDMDDALSIEQVQDGYILGVHITDVASYLPPATPLDEEARARATSLYLPEATYHMLPKVLSEKKLSLRQGEVRPCLSCMFKVSRSFEILSGEVVPSLVRIATRYNYDQVEELLETEHSELLDVYQIAVARETSRLDGGGVKVFKRELIVRVSEDGTPILREIDEHSPARSMVGEMMVLANSLLADFAVAHNLAAAFRTQDAPDETAQEQSDDAPPGPASDYQGRSRLKKSSISTQAGLHASLGLRAYLQATSPIRRYLDLCNQRQILHYLIHGTALFSRQEFAELIYSCEEPLAIANQVNKESKRFWLLRYLEQHLADRQTKDASGAPLITGTVLRTDMKYPLVELDEIFLPTTVRFGERRVKPGDKFTFRINGLNAVTDFLRLEPV